MELFALCWITHCASFCYFLPLLLQFPLGLINLQCLDPLNFSRAFLLWNDLFFLALTFEAPVVLFTWFPLSLTFNHVINFPSTTGFRFAALDVFMLSSLYWVLRLWAPILHPNSNIFLHHLKTPHLHKNEHKKRFWIYTQICELMIFGLW